MQDLDHIIQGLQPIGEAGFPSVICPVIFIGGCNFTCPYCLNADLVKNPKDRKFIPLSEIEKYVKENGEEHILISGGEPCLNPALGDLVDALKKMGLKVRLSTNGSRQHVLYSMIFDYGVSFVAMDIKTNIWYGDKWKKFMTEDERNSVRDSVEILDSTLMGNKEKAPEGFTFEYRTTMYPRAVSREDVMAISETVNKDAIWYLQQFRPREGLLSPEASSVKPYTNEELDKFVNLAKNSLKKTYVRWP